MAKGLKIKFNMAGLKDIEKRLADLRSTTGIVRKASDILFAHATQIMNASKLLVPVDTGFLRQSGHVQLPEITGTRVRVQLGYVAEYALAVHENLNARHRVGQSRFLEIPFILYKAGALTKFSTALRAARAFGIASRKLAA